MWEISYESVAMLCSVVVVEKKEWVKAPARLYTRVAPGEQ